MASPHIFTEKVSKYIQNLASKTRAGYPCQVLVHSDKHNVHVEMSNVASTMPFHGASIGKMFTATIIGMLQAMGKLQLDGKAGKYLPQGVLDDLFVYDSVDYQADVTVRHLLCHTSGMADYFENKTIDGASFAKEVLQNPDKKWTPGMLVDYTRTEQKAVGPLGTFNYSDTGYVLLGLIVERVYKKPFNIALKELIFEPLGMSDSYLMFYDKPQSSELAPAYFNNTEVTKTNILSCDWAGGGIVSTLSDLLKFQQAFWKYELVSEQFVNEMKQTHNKYHAGIHYGMGMMELRFNEFFFTLPKQPRPLGHSGILGTGMFYDPIHDLHIIINLGSNKLIPKSIRALIVIEQIALKNLTTKK